MPAKAPAPHIAGTGVLGTLGSCIRQRRKALRVSATTAAEAAGMSRVTLHRIERGEASVTMGAYANAMAALGVQIRVVDLPAAVSAPLEKVQAHAAPLRIALADYPQLKQLAWMLPGAAELTAEEAFGLYERNWRHIDDKQIDDHERALIDTLTRTLGQGQLLV
ncbi:MAG: transcriptional regulator, family [Variovorax sp.]|jgi:transcriptional regulator with XRE-family HTH domain|nr:transcriptional regulator, family [Variovorax sp.]